MPGVGVGDPPAERGADGGRDDEDDAVEGEDRTPLSLREAVVEDRLLTRCQPAAADALEDAEEDQPRQRRGQPARQAADREHCDARHVKRLAAEDRGEPAADRQDDRVGDEVARQHPRRLVVADAEVAGDVREADVGDARVEHLHEGGDAHHDGKDPRVVPAVHRQRQVLREELAAAAVAALRRSIISKVFRAGGGHGGASEGRLQLCTN